MAYGDNGGVVIDGLAKFRKTLRQAGDDLSDFKQVNARAAAIAANAGKQRSPDRTGRLLGTIRSSGTKTAGVVRAGSAKVPYAGPIHWGWFARNIRPQTFLADGGAQSQPQWVPLYEDYIEKTIDKIQGK